MCFHNNSKLKEYFHKHEIHFMGNKGFKQCAKMFIVINVCIFILFMEKNKCDSHFFPILDVNLFFLTSFYCYYIFFLWLSSQTHKYSIFKNTPQHFDMKIHEDLLIFNVDFSETKCTTLCDHSVMIFFSSRWTLYKCNVSVI